MISNLNRYMCFNLISFFKIIRLFKLDFYNKYQSEMCLNLQNCMHFQLEIVLMQLDM